MYLYVGKSGREGHQRGNEKSWLAGWVQIGLGRFLVDWTELGCLPSLLVGIVMV